MPFLHLSNRVVLVIQAVVAIGLLGDDLPVSGPELNTWFGLTPRYLEQSLQLLQQGGILDSKRGIMGGYKLGMPPRQITVRRIAEWVLKGEHPLDLVVALGSHPLAEAVIAPYVISVIDEWNRDLEDMTIGDLMRAAKKSGITLRDIEPA